MAAVLVAPLAGVEPETRLLGGGAPDDETDVDRIQHVVSAIEDHAAVRAGLEELAQVGHGAIVQIRRPEPETVEGAGEITVLLHEIGPPVTLAADRGVHGIGVGLGPDGGAFAVRADLREGNGLPEAAPGRVVALGALPGVDRPPGGGRPGPDCVLT